MDWPTAILGISTAVISAGSALLGSYLANRGQRKIKEAELNAQSALKARELLFNSYQERAKRTAEGASSLGKQIAEFFMGLEGDDDKEKLQSLPFGTFLVLQTLFEELRTECVDIIEVLESLGLKEKYRGRIEILEGLISIDIQSLEKEDSKAILDLFTQLPKISAAVYYLKEIFLSATAERLFEPYINKKTAIEKRSLWVRLKDRF